MYTCEKVFYADVAVVGGGSAGCSAAITAARAGLNTIVLEQQISLGGMMTNAYIGGLAGLREGNAKEFHDRMDAKGRIKPSNLCPLYDPEQAKLELELMVIGAGARVLYDLTIFDVVMESENRIKAVVGYCRGTKIIVYAKHFIDGSGDANLAAMAGAPVEYSSPEFCGYSSASSMHARVAHVNIPKWEAASADWDKKQIEDGVPEEQRKPLWNTLMERAVKNNELPANFVAYKGKPGGRTIPGLDFDEENDRTILWIMKAHNCRNTDVEDLTRQVLEQHRHLDYSEKFLNKYCPGYEHARISAIPPMNGLRDSRRIVGEYVLSGADMAGQSRFADSIARFDDMFDLHHPVTKNLVSRHTHVRTPAEGKGFYRETQCAIDMHPYAIPEGFEARTDPKCWCEIPYGTILPQKIDNLLVVGRCYSADFYALGGARLISTMMSLGQAAGAAAKLCLEEGVGPRELDGKKVHDYLVNVEGVPLDTVCGRLIDKQNTPGTAYYAEATDNVKYR